MVEHSKGFREYLLSLEDYYMNEHTRIKDSKPFAAETERRMFLLCGHILSEFDRYKIKDANK